MNMTDPVADMLSRIRNGVRAKLNKVDIPSSRLKVEIARILKDEGYVSNFKQMEDDKQGVLRWKHVESEIGLRRENAELLSQIQSV